MSPIAIPNPSVGLGTGSTEQAVIGTGLSVPSGIDMPISYNGLILNNRQWIDTFVVTKISGLSDATIRDDRENNPDADGETAFNAYYGGKTFTLSGYIRAFNLAKLDDMEQAMRQCFHSIKTEQAMVFHHRNPAGVAQIMCRKGAELVIDDEQTTENYFRREFMITMKASNPRILAKTETLISKDLGWSDTFSFDSLNKYTLISGSGVTISSGYMRPTDNNGNKIRRNSSIRVPNTRGIVEWKNGSGATPMVGMDLRIYLRYANASNCVYAKMSEAGQLRIIGVVGGIETTLVSDTAAISPVTSGTTYWLDFEATGNILTAKIWGDNDPRFAIPGGTLKKSITFTITDPTQAAAFGGAVRGDQAVWLEGGTSNGTSFGFTNFSVTATTLSAESVITAPNFGNGDAQPVITVGGKMTNPIITNSNRSESLNFTKNGGLTIAAGDEIAIDIAEDTIVNNAGLRQWNHLTITSDWMELSPGEDEILLSASGLGAWWVDGALIVPSISFLYRSTWV